MSPIGKLLLAVILASLVVAIGAAVSPVYAGYSVAGVVGDGSVSSSADFTQQRTNFSVELISSDMMGRGQISFANEGNATGTTLSSTQAALVGSGRLYGSTSVLAFVAMDEREITNETEGIGEDDSGWCAPLCPFDTPAELANITIPAINSMVSTRGTFDITSGQVAIGSTVDVPMPSIFVSQEIAMQGDGSVGLTSGYLTMQDKITDVDKLAARTRITGDGIEFVGRFDYSAI